MVRKIKAKAILRLNDQGLSGRAIARSLGIARQSVAEVYSLLFPGRGERESVYERPTGPGSTANSRASA